MDINHCFKELYSLIGKIKESIMVLSIVNLEQKKTQLRFRFKSVSLSVPMYKLKIIIHAVSNEFYSGSDPTTCKSTF